jgi:hypothetical protein
MGYYYSYGVTGIVSTLAVVGACELHFLDASGCLNGRVPSLTRRPAQTCSSPATAKPSMYDDFRATPPYATPDSHAHTTNL